MGLKNFPSLKSLLVSIGKSFTSMKDTTMIIFFVFTIYAVIGLQVSVLKRFIIFIIILFILIINFKKIIKCLFFFFLDVERFTTTEMHEC